jgi:hypothetical protein
VTSWWAVPAVVAILLAAWLATVFAEALEDDRGWNRWAARGLAFLWIVGMLTLLDLVTPAWGEGRKVVAVLASFVLLSVGEVAHERHTGKPVIRLPKKS